jgi:predicted site-specific integrase-resolvase
MITEKKQQKEEQTYYDAFDVARILRIHFKTALKWGKDGKLPSFKIGNRRYFPSEEILALRRMFCR